MQAVKGYLTDGLFTPDNGVILPRRAQAILVIAELHFGHEPATTKEEISPSEIPEEYATLVEKVGAEEAQRRIAWLKRLHESIALSMDEEPFELPPRARDMRPPVLFDEEVSA